MNIMNITENNTISELVAQDYRTASVFKKYSIDFCCNGNRTIHEACIKSNMDPSALLIDLDQSVKKNNNNSTDYQSWPLDLLTDYIEKKHHRYVENKTQEIIPYLEKIRKVHGSNHPELAEIENHFKDSAGELAKHMKKEELILFPYIRKMVNHQLSGSKVDAPPFGTVQNPITMMHQEHNTEGERFRTISQLSDNYTPPPDACSTYRVAFALLKEFEEDLHLHIHLENNILFPQAVALEETLKLN